MSVPANSAEWSAQPAVRVTVENDSNRRLDLEPVETQGLSVVASIALARSIANAQVALTPRFVLNRFAGSERELDSNDFGVDTRFARAGERWETSVRASGARDSTLTTELTDTGITNGRARRETLSADVLASYSLGERSQAQVQAASSRVEFDRAEGTGLVPYDYHSAALGYVWQINESSDVVVQAYAGRLDVAATGRRDDTRGARVYLRRKASDRLRFELNVGLSETQSGAQAEQSHVFGVRGTWTGELTTLDWSLTRDVEPSALGRLVDADSMTASFDRRLSPRLSVFANARYVRREDLLFGVFAEERKYTNYSVGGAWRLTESTRIELAAARSQQSFDLLDRTADGTRVAATLQWSPNRLSISR